jgi:predicted NBD/HSP70 family sugar kinase
MTRPGPVSSHMVRGHNLALVLRQIIAAPQSSRAQIASAAGLTRATVSALVEDLLDAGLVRTLEPDRSSRGRPGNPLEVSPFGSVAIGIEIAVDYIAVCAMDLTGHVHARRIMRYDNRRARTGTTIATTVRLIEAMVAEAPGIEWARIAGLAVAMPGIIGSAGRMSRVPNLPSWQGRDVRADLAQALPPMLAGLRIEVDNEANYAALAHLGVDPSVRDFVLLSGEIGVGAGIVRNGELYRGVRGYAGELGHVVVDPRGAVCHCGARGCLEQVAGQEALLRAAGGPGPRATRTATRADADDWTEAAAAMITRAEAGNRAVLRVLRRVGSAIGIALAGAINLLDIPTVVLGGLYARLGPWLIEPISAELDQRVLDHDWVTAPIHLSPLGADAAARGAGGAVIAEIVRDPAAYLRATRTA